MKKNRWMKISAAVLAMMLWLPLTALAQATLPPVNSPTPLPMMEVMPTPIPTPLPTLPGEGMPVLNEGERMEENRVYALPDAAPEPMVEVVMQENEYAIDLAAYYAEYEEIYFSTGESYMQYPALTLEERERFPAVKKNYEAGQRPSESILNRTENVNVGLYQLPAEQYQGETAFLILPYRALTDVELLQIIDAYAALDMDFQPEMLNWRNCMRGGGINMSRSFAGDERARYELLTDMYRRGNAAPAEVFTALPMDDGMGVIALDAEEFCGMTEYRFFPARRMTDEELLKYIAFEMGGITVSGDEFRRWENQTRMQLHDLLGMPLTVELQGESIGKESDRTVFAADRQVYSAVFHPVGESNWLQWNAELSTDGETLIAANAVTCEPAVYSDLHCNPFDEKWSRLAAEWVQTTRSDGAAPIKVECRGEGVLDSSRFGAAILLTMEDGSIYTLYMDYVTERPFMVVYMDAERNRVVEEYWVNDAMEEMRRWREE